jgi:hypothetical protein
MGDRIDPIGTDRKRKETNECCEGGPKRNREGCQCVGKRNEKEWIESLIIYFRRIFSEEDSDGNGETPGIRESGIIEDLGEIPQRLL